MKTKTKKCDECRNGSWHPVNGILICAKGHKPRFYKPLYYGEENWGWKRRCNDFEKKPTE